MSVLLADTNLVITRLFSKVLLIIRLIFRYSRQIILKELWAFSAIPLKPYFSNLLLLGRNTSLQSSHKIRKSLCCSFFTNYIRSLSIIAFFFLNLEQIDGVRINEKATDWVVLLMLYLLERKSNDLHLTLAIIVNYCSNYKVIGPPYL